MLCRCARAAMKRCTSTSAIPSVDISGARQSRMGPYAAYISAMTSSSLSYERQVPVASDSNGVRPRANMSAVAEESYDEEHAETEFAVPEIPLQMRPLSEQGSAGARRCRRGAHVDLILCPPPPSFGILANLFVAVCRSFAFSRVFHATALLTKRGPSS